MNEHLPALQVVLPLLAAPVCVLLRPDPLARILATAVCWVAFAIALSLQTQVLGGAPISYALGGWAPPWGIEYRVDQLNAFVLVVVSGIAAIVLVLGPGGASHSIPEGRERLFYAAFLLCLAGLLGITITGDAFNVFVFLEISSLASYVLISLGRGRRALMAAFSYLVMGTMGGTFILIGIGLAYLMTGTLNLVDMAGRLQELGPNRTVLVGFAFLTVGISIKLAVFPLHQWLPNAYSYAPSMVSAFLAGTATKVMYYLLVRVVFGVFGAAFVFGTLGLDLLLLPLSVLAMFIGSLAAIYQTDLKRLLAYSSIGQLGYMTLGLSFASVTGVTGGLVHLANHALVKAGMFLAVACISARIGSTRIADLRGLGRRMPLTTAIFVAGGLGLIGVPGTAGFVSKWYFGLAALEAGQHGVLFLILLSSLLAAVYVWRVVEIAYFETPPDGGARDEAPGLMLLPAGVLIGLSLLFGVWTEPTVGRASAAALDLLGGP